MTRINLALSDFQKGLLDEICLDTEQKMTEAMQNALLTYYWAWKECKNGAWVISTKCLDHDSPHTRPIFNGLRQD